MRFLIQLRSLKDCSYDLKYFHKLQGFVYSLLKGTEYSILHDRGGYKFFCFSNIFPIGDMKAGDGRNLLISSPDRLFIKLLKDKLSEFIDANKPLNIGEMQFELETISAVRTRLGRNCRLISATPIVIRIPEKNYEKYGIEEKYRKKRYVYWRKKYAFNAFIKQLNENLFKKYNEFYKQEIEEFHLFEQFIFKKEVCNHVIIGGEEYKMIGSIWEFIFSYLNKEQRKILSFGIDCGFGERNSLGFGFMNVIKNVRRS